MGYSLFLSFSLSLTNSYAHFRLILPSPPPRSLPSCYQTICLWHIPQHLHFVITTSTPVTTVACPTGDRSMGAGFMPMCWLPCPQGPALCLAHSRGFIKKRWMNKFWWSGRYMLALTWNWQELRGHLDKGLHWSLASLCSVPDRDVTGFHMYRSKCRDITSAQGHWFFTLAVLLASSSSSKLAPHSNCSLPNHRGGYSCSVTSPAVVSNTDGHHPTWDFFIFIWSHLPSPATSCFHPTAWCQIFHHSDGGFLRTVWHWVPDSSPDTVFHTSVDSTPLLPFHTQTQVPELLMEGNTLDALFLEGELGY